MGAQKVGSWHCAGCARIGLKLAREFASAVNAGTFNELGYTPAEWRAKQKKESQR